MSYNKHEFQPYETLFGYQLNDMDYQLYGLSPKYRNLMNPENTTNCYGSGATADHLTTASSNVSVYAELVPFTDYVVTKLHDTNAAKRFGVYLCDSVALNSPCKTLVYKSSASSSDTISFNSENYKYVVVFCKPGSGDVTYPDVQLEIGTMATGYVEYGLETYGEAYALKPDGGMMRVDNVIASLQAQVSALQPKGWTLKGTIANTSDGRGNIDAGVSVDLSGCTELRIIGTATATGNVSIFTNGSALAYNAFTTSRKAVYGVWTSTDIGIDCIVCKYSTSASAQIIADNMSGYCWTNNKKIKDITKILFNTPANITSCDVKIYAR